jgi:hypothetical protein
VSWRTADRWAKRYRELGEAGMVERSSRPHHSPNRTPVPVVRKLVHLRWKHRLGPVAIGARLGMPASTVHVVLVRCRLNKLWHLDRVTGSRSAVMNTPIPARCCTWTSRSSATSPTAAAGATSGASRATRTGPGRRASPEASPATQIGHRVRAHRPRRPLPGRLRRDPRRRDRRHRHPGAAQRGGLVRRRSVTVERVLSDNGSAYKSHLWRDTCAELGITVKKTRPYRPQTNGKIERFHRTLADGWAFKRFYNSEHARRAALPAWIHEYNHHRPHTAIGKATPITRLTNLPGQYT